MSAYREAMVKRLRGFQRNMDCSPYACHQAADEIDLLATTLRRTLDRFAAFVTDVEGDGTPPDPETVAVLEAGRRVLGRAVASAPTTDAYCEASVTVDGDQRVGCLDPLDHEGHHHGWTAKPCPDCLGLEQHADGCPRMGETDSGMGLPLEFTDEGVYWVAEWSTR